MKKIFTVTLFFTVFSIVSCTKTAEDYERRAKVRMSNGDLNGALADFDKAIALEPDFLLAYANRGNARRQAGDYDGAIRDYDKVIADAASESGVAGIFLYRGLVRAESKDFIGALKDYDKAISLRPENNSPNHYYYYRALTKFELNDKTGAWADMLHAKEKGNKESVEWLKSYCD